MPKLSFYDPLAALVDTDTLYVVSDGKSYNCTYATLKETIVADIGPLQFQNTINCSANPDYPAADKGHVYIVSIGGKIGGASGTVVDAGDMLICRVDGSAAGDQATVGANWTIVQANLVYETSAAALAENGTAAVGTSGKVAQSNHVHPKDTAKVSHDLATAENDFLVGAPSPFGTWVKKTLAETKTIVVDVTEAPSDGNLYARKDENWTDISAPTRPALDVQGWPDSVPETPILKTNSFFSIAGDTHLNTDWQIRNSADTATIWESLADTSNKLSIEVPIDNLVAGTQYIFKVRHRGTTYGASAWDSVTATTTASFPTDIGDPGAQGFGVGIYPDTLPTDFSAMTGTTDPTHDNYGNYEYDDGSICCFVPKFWYRIGHENNPTYTDYGVNSIDIKGYDAGAGYVLHRAFTDGGAEKHGFFFDKYMASKHGTNDAALSAKDGVPLSLATTAGYTKTEDLTGCTGILADAVVLSRARGAGVWQCASLFAWSAIRMISLAHAQASTATTNCAWYDNDGTTNFPKGCNNNALSDTDDTYDASTNPDGVLYTTAGDSGNANKPLTGSGAPFSKTTHNGQPNGIADVNGGMRELAIGMTMPGATATDTNYDTTTTSVWVLKDSVEIATLTGGWNDDQDSEVNAVWQHADKISTLYAQIDIGLGHNVNEKFGDGTNQVLSGGSTGSGYTTDSLGWPKDADGHSAAGTNLFGTDQWYLRHRANQAPLVCGAWGSAASAGVWSSYVRNYRSVADVYSGFRSFAYAS